MNDGRADRACDGSEHEDRGSLHENETTRNR
jgi:hypothetical protein